MRISFFLLLAIAAGCGRSDNPQVTPSYDKITGKLTRLSADLNRDGQIDTWTYMDGTIPIRTEQDLNGDGRIERWEFSRPDGSSEKVAQSRRNSGQPDMWTYLDSKGETTRIEFASTDSRDAAQAARVDRVEFYTAGRLTRAEEDTDGDGRLDKWEQHDGPAVVFVEFDYDKDGKPDERITFGPDGKIVSRQKLGTPKDDA